MKMAKETRLQLLLALLLFANGCQLRNFNQKTNSSQKQYIAQQAAKDSHDTIYWMTKETKILPENLCGCLIEGKSLGDQIEPPKCIEKIKCVVFGDFKKNYLGLLNSERFQSDERENLRHLHQLQKQTQKEIFELNSYLTKIQDNNSPRQNPSPEIQAAKQELELRDIELTKSIQQILPELQLLRNALPKLKDSFEEIESSLRTNKVGYNLYESHMLNPTFPHLSITSKIFRKAFVSSGVQNYDSNKEFRLLPASDALQAFDLKLKPIQNWGRGHKHNDLPDSYAVVHLSLPDDLGLRAEKLNHKYLYDLYLINTEPNKEMYMQLMENRFAESTYEMLESLSACVVVPYFEGSFNKNHNSAKKDLLENYIVTKAFSGGSFLAASTENMHEFFLFECGFIESVKKKWKKSTALAINTKNFSLYGINALKLTQSKVINGKIKVFSLGDLEHILAIDKLEPKALFETFKNPK